MRIVLLVVPLLFFASFQAGAYDPKKYTYDDIKVIKDNSKKHLINYCKNKPMSLEKCYPLAKRNFFKSVNIYSERPHGNKIFDFCYNEHLINYDFDEFNGCVDDKMSLIKLKTGIPEMNYLFLFDYDFKNSTYNLCNHRYSLLDVKNKNNCFSEQEKNTKRFKSKWFNSVNIKNDRIRFQECVPKFSGNDSLGRFFIDFKQTLECVDGN